MNMISVLEKILDFCKILFIKYYNCVSVVSTQKLRANLYAALLSFLQLNRQQCEPILVEGRDVANHVSLLDEPKASLRPVWVSQQASLQVLLGFGERLLVTLCQDFSGGHDICKVSSRE